MTGYAEDKEWDKWRSERIRPGILSKEQKVKIYLGLSTLAMGFFLALLYFSP